MQSSMYFRLLLFPTVAVSILFGCVNETEKALPFQSQGRETSDNECIDEDGDGYPSRIGNCPIGRDCDDSDPSVTDECYRCVHQAEGCPCEEGQEPITCNLEPTNSVDGRIICHEGTRFCRDGRWTDCLSVKSFFAVSAHNTAKLVDVDAGVPKCGACEPNCFRITDPLDPVDGGLPPENTEGNVQFADGGGITLCPIDAGEKEGIDAGEEEEEPECTPGASPDMDCDGIPDEFDPFSGEKPFETNNEAVFLQLGPGQSGTGTVDVEFFMNNADIYFLLDQTGSMADERINLKNGLTSGRYLGDDVQCADTDFDGQPNNELKDQGIIGSIRCLIRDAWFGAGFHRELPFYHYGDNDEVIFRHLQDVTRSIPATLDAINNMTNDGNVDWPEGHSQALWSVATGNGLYMGYNRPGVPTRTNCPEATWGYPCFRDGAIPIIVLFTDAMFHNGPDSRYDYPDSFSISQGTTPEYVPVPNTNESFSNLYQVGDITDIVVTLTGNTRSMQADVLGSVVSCDADDGANDAVFRFELSSEEQVTIDTAGSSYDTVISLHSGIPILPPSPVSVSGNETHVDPYPVGDVYDSWFIGSGNTDFMAAEYQGSVIDCDANTYANDAVYAFDLSHSADVTIDTVGSDFDTVISLHDGPIPLRPAPISVSKNDTVDSAYSVGDVYGQYKVFTGSTAESGITSNYLDAIIGCDAHTNADDAVYAFSLSRPSRIRIDTEDSEFDTVISLHNGPIANPSIVSVSGANEDMGSAADVGSVDGRWIRVKGNTSSMVADFDGDFVGCSANSRARDAVVSFSVLEETNVQIDTEESCDDTVISLHRGGAYAPGSVEDITVPANTGNDNHTNAYDLRELLGSYWDFQGGSIAPFESDYSGSVIGCGAGDEGPDIAFRFSLAEGTHVRIDASDSPFDSVISIHDGAIPLQSSTTVNDSNEDEASAYDVGTIDGRVVSFNGDTGSMAADYDSDTIGCSAHSNANDAVYTFSLDAMTEVEIDTEGSSYDTVIGLFANGIDTGGTATRPGAVDIGTDGETKSEAYDAGTIDNQWKVFAGNTRWMHDNWGRFGCSSSDSSRDAFVQFSLDTRRTVTIDTENSNFDTVIGLFQWNNNQPIDCNRDGGPGNTSVITTTLNAGTYFVIVKGDSSTSRGAYQLSIRDDDVLAFGGSGSALACDDDSGANSTSRITRILAAGTYYVVVKGDVVNDDGDYKITFRDLTNSPPTNRVACDNGAGTSSIIERWLDAGDYYLIVKAAEGSHGANYKIVMQDLDALTMTRIGCDNDSGPGDTSLMQENLQPGTYYVVVKGDRSFSDGCYNLNIRDLDNSGANRLTCDNDSGPDSTSVIERDLDAGDYYIVVKGDASSDEGDYTLTLRDVINVPDNRISCNNDDSGSTSRIDASLSAGSYYVVVKGDQQDSKGEYRISIRDSDNTDDKRLECDNDDSTGSTSKIVRTLDPGSYYVVLKGDDDDSDGPYQITFGTGASSSGSFRPIPWSDTLSALQDKGIKVMSVLSCWDDPNYGNADGYCNTTRAQAREIATETDSMGENGNPLVYDIDSDGDGLSITVVDGIKELAKYLSMDVSMRVVFEPDENPGFLVNVETVDEGPGDGCEPPIDIEHQNCLPGAVPKFDVTFTNPLNAPVPLNPDPEKEGYDFKIELIGNGQYLLDTVPVYIIPEPAPPERETYTSANYWQDVQAITCTGNTRPDWSNLYFTTDMPEGTSIDFDACTSDAKEDLDSCTYQRVATVTASGSCTEDADCVYGYCGSNDVCRMISGNRCEEDSECVLNASCGAGHCQYSEQPADIASALGIENYRFNLRMRMTLNPDSTLSKRPTLIEWTLNYVCTPLE